MSDSVVNDAFRNTASAAEAMLSKMESEASGVEAPPVVAAPVEAPVEAPPVVEDKPATPPQPIDVSPDTPVRIKVDGVEKVVKASEYTELLQRNDVITQRHQALAAQRNQLETHYAQVEAQLQQRALFLEQQAQQLAQQGDPVTRLVQQLNQNQQAEAGPKPNDIATIGEVQAAINAFRAQQQQELMQMRQQTQQEIFQAREQAKSETLEQAALAQDQKRVNDTIAGILNTPDGKLLAEINPLAESVIRFNAFKMGPQNVDQAVENLQLYAKGWAEKVRGTLAQQQTAQAVNTAKTVLEAPSGTPVSTVKAPQPRALKPDGSIDWVALRARSMTYLE